jgi:hypothetical protein
MQAPPLELLVKPSGNLSSPISHRLNQPSYTTLFPENGETADSTNPCISMVMGTAYTDHTTLMYDQVCRRDDNSYGSTKYPPFVREVHRKFARDIMESSEAKVEIVYGKKAREAIMMDSSLEKTPLPLWGPYHGTILILIHESSFKNSQWYRFRKVIVCAHHPERLFHDKIEGLYLTSQENSIAAAATMACVPHIPNYYRERLWQTIQPPSKQRILETLLKKYGDQLLFLPVTAPNGSSLQVKSLASFDSENEILKTSENEIVQFSGTDNIWEKFFAVEPHSNPDLFALLPTAMDAASKACECSESWIDPSAFPPPVQAWWKGQKRVLFYSATVSSLWDVLSVLHRCETYHKEWQKPKSKNQKHSEQIDKTSLPQVVRRLMEIQKQFIEELGSLTPDWSRFVYYRFDGPLKAKCCTCGSRVPDICAPLFTVNRLDNFVPCAKSTCFSKHCNGKRTWSRPLDDSIEITRQATAHSAEPKRQYNIFPSLLCELQENLSDQQRQPIETICIRCKELTGVKNEDHLYIDHSPIWTVGDKRPLYVEPSHHCVRCKRENKSKGRLIPRDPSIPSISTRVLYDLGISYGRYDKDVLKLLMDAWMPSSRNYKSRRAGIELPPIGQSRTHSPFSPENEVSNEGSATS